MRRPTPTSGHAAVLLASQGKPLSDAAVAQALDLAGGASIHVLSVARIYGTSLGLQHPGLLPSKRELAEQQDIVADAMRRIKKGGGGRATGEVIATRTNAKTFAGVAQRYSVRHVVLDPAGGSRLRRLIEGDAAASVRRRLGGGVTVHVVQP